MALQPPPFGGYDIWRDWVGPAPSAAGALLSLHRQPEYCTRLVAGQDGVTNQPVWTDPDSPLLAISAGGGGKTSSLMAINLILASGPALSTSAKPDTAIATAGWRSLVGCTLQHTARGRQLPFLDQRRFSPVQGCQSWEFAGETAARHVGYGSQRSADRHNQQGRNPFFDRQSALLFAACLFWSAHKGKDMEPIVEISQSIHHDDLNPVAKDLEHLERDGVPGAKFGRRIMQGILSGPPEQMGGTLSTFANAVAPWASETALASQRNPNFWATDFVRTKPGPTLVTLDDSYIARMIGRDRLMGRTDTLYITDLDAECNEHACYLELLYRIRFAANELARSEEK